MTKEFTPINDLMHAGTADVKTKEWSPKVTKRGKAVFPLAGIGSALALSGVLATGVASMESQPAASEHSTSQHGNVTPVPAQTQIGGETFEPNPTPTSEQ